MLRLENVKKFYKLFNGKKFYALKDISFTVDQGKILGFLGPNGAGKTTTIKILLSLMRASEGKVIYNKKLNYIHYASENPYIYDNVTGYEFMKFCAKLLPEKIDIKEIDDILKTVDLFQYKDNLIKSYSKGMKQRLNIAQSLLGKSEFYIFDEPASGLDPIGRKLVRDIIINLKNQGKTVFFSSHQVSEVELISDKIVIINNGLIVKEGFVKDLLFIEKNYEIQLEGRNQEIIDKLKSLINSYKMTNDSLIINFEKSNMWEILNILKENKINVYSINPAKITLEELFLESIGGGDNERKII